MSTFWQHIIDFWHRLPLRVKGIVLAAIPLLAIVVSSTFAYLGNRERERAETDVARHFDVVTDLEELLTLVVNAESGMRGYLLTRRVEFLQPYRTATRLLPGKMLDLRNVVQQEPGLKPRLDKGRRVNQIEALINEQMKSLATMQSTLALKSATATNPPDLYSQLESSKQRMDNLRTQLRAMRVEEKELLSERLTEIAWVRHRDYFAIILTLVIGLAGRFLAMHLFDVGIVQRVQQVQENVRCLAEGKPLAFPASSKIDALGELEREVAATEMTLRRVEKTVTETPL